ncbi:MAG TPA: sensor histidine kinase [Ornithinibacter sp.]|nr:sensor histidine kinase [Ornithinibacter sp.]
MVPRTAWFLTLGAVGGGSLVYVVVVRGFTEPSIPPGAGLAWPVLGALPFFVFGMWLLTATSSRLALYVALAGTATAAGAAYETLLWTEPELLSSPSLPLINTVGLTVDGVAAAAFLLTFATFPDGVLERRWQRVAVLGVWACAFVGPLYLLTSDRVVLPEYLGITSQMANPYVVDVLSPLRPVVDMLFAWPPTLLAMIILASRAFWGDERTRRRLRVMTVTVLAVLVSWMFWSAVPLLGLSGTPLELVFQSAVLAGMIALPVAGIHGILRHGAFDVADADRARVVVRSSSALITVLYAVAVAAPALLLMNRLDPLGAVLVTAIAAVVLLPVRGLAERLVRRTVLGDRDHHLALLSELGARLEQAMELDEVLARLAEGVRRGLDASWVRVRVLGVDEEVATVPAGVAGTVTGAPVATQDLIRGDQRLGVLELGPPLHGEYGADELALLQTVARQATTTVANVRLTARLGEQLEELSASRVRLITAQDEERRRIERNLHDGIQQSVVALIANLGRARQRLQRDELRPLELVELQDQAREMLTDLRELARGIHPQVLSDRGLVAAVESRSSRFPVPLAVIADEGTRAARFAPDVEAVAFYTVREALANVAKHSGASCARVSLSVVEDRLRVEVVDDGSGFSLEQERSASGGLTNIGDRVAAVGGRLGVDRAPGGGARLVVDLPLSGSIAESTDVAVQVERSMAPDEDEVGVRQPALAAELPLIAHPVGESARA